MCLSTTTESRVANSMPSRANGSANRCRSIRRCKRRLAPAHGDRSGDRRDPRHRRGEDNVNEPLNEFTKRSFEEAKMPKFFKSLFGQVVIALVVGIVVGVLYPQFGASLTPIGYALMNLITVLITPIVLCVVVLGIAGAG